MANYTTAQDIVADILFRAGEATGGTSDFNTKATQYLNRAYQIIWMGGGEFVPGMNEDWWWMRKDPPGTIIFEPKITSGTVNVTNNNSSVVFSAAPSPKIDKNVKTWFFQVDKEQSIFRVSTHVSGSTSAVLDSRYTGLTATAANYKLFKLEYTLATDVLRLVSPMRSYKYGRNEIEGVSMPSLDRDFPLWLIQGGVSRKFAPVSEQKVRFSHLGGSTGTELFRAEYDYNAAPADLANTTGSIPVVPRHYRRSLADLGLYYVLMDKNDNRADAVGLMAKSGLQAMERENRHRQSAFARTNGMIIPRPRLLPQNLTPIRTESGLIVG